MDRSSPLAALQPHSVPFGYGHGHWNFGSDLSHHTRSGTSCGMGVHNFNFKELSMQRRTGDYSSGRPLRSSSPTASLAVDLSRNFHIDQSPLPPTPRRSLFTQTVFGSFDDNELMSTPPPTDLSPCLEIEMDISPLPHKPAFNTFPIQVQSPTPVATPPIDNMGTSPVCLLESPLETLRIPERRRPAPLKPSFIRAKAHSTTCASIKSAGLIAERPPPFRFGSEVHAPTKPSPLMTLEECFASSPERKETSMSVDTTPTLAHPRPRSSNQVSSIFGKTNTGSPFAVSPSGMLPRRNTGQGFRPRKQFRRSLSMFEHPDKYLTERKSECGLTPICDDDHSYDFQLPHFVAEGENLPRITQETMVDILDGKHISKYDQSHVVDCRFEYEFEGGHIDGAVNCTNRDAFTETFFQGAQRGKTLIIFHCEYSAHRAPLTAANFRSKDRDTNVHRYPQLSYPEVYVLDGGYSAFYKNHKPRCFPQNYIEMNDIKHITACEKGLGRIKQQRQKLGRAQTFAFGQRSTNDSPTCAARSMSGPLASGKDICMEDITPTLVRTTAARGRPSH